jgi:osmotically-inducible protein OsmY
VIALVLFPFRLAFGFGRLGYRTGLLTARTSVRATRFVGLSRMMALGFGVALGLLVAPTTGAELRDRIRRQWEARGAPASDDAVADRVRYELSHSPRTWHLPQPAVEVVSGRAILTGDAPHATGKADIERAAAAVPGVAEVENRLVVGPGNGERD